MLKLSCEVLGETGGIVGGMFGTKIFELLNVTVTVSPVNRRFCRVETHFSEACLLNIFSNVIFASKLFAFKLNSSVSS